MSDILIYAAIAILISAIAILYSRRRNLTTVPGLKPSSDIYGNLQDIAKIGTLPDFLTKLHKDYGGIASFWWEKQLIVSVASPELLKQTSAMFDRPKLLFQAFEPLITPHSIQYRNGISGKTLYTRTSSAYSFDMMNQYVPLLSKIAYELADKWKSISLGEHIPLEKNMFALAIKMICQTSFGNWFMDDQEITRIHAAYQKCMNEMERRIAEGTPGPESEQEKQFQQGKRDLAVPILKALELRKKRIARDDDRILLDILFETCESEEDIIGNAVSYLIGGFHTTGSLLTWSFYFLAANHDIQERVFAEMVEVLGEEELTNAVIKDLVYLRQVLNETLRCSQLAPWAARVQDSDTQIGGHKIPADTPVILALGCLHHKEDLWPEPENFDPERFSEENLKSKPAHSFEPFGFSGKRKCPGYRFSLTEATVILSVIVRKFRFELVPGQVVKPFHGFVTKPMDEIWITVHERN